MAVHDLQTSSLSAGSIGPHKNSAQAMVLTTTGSSGSVTSRNRASGDPWSSMRIRKLVSKWIIAIRWRVAERMRSESRSLGVPSPPDLRLGRRLISGVPGGPATSHPPVMTAARLRYGSLFEALGLRDVPAARQPFQRADGANVEGICGLDRHDSHALHCMAIPGGKTNRRGSPATQP